MSLFLLMILLSVLFAFQALSQAVSENRDKPIEGYVKFIKEHQQNPIDYILGLFEKADIVILCERSHPEITQYRLITDIIRDERFIKNVGNVFLEIGNFSLQPYVEDFLMKDKLSKEEVKRRLFHILRNCSSSPLWEYTNYFDFFHEVYQLNRRLPLKEKIHIYPSNMSFSWEGMTEEKYEELRKNRTRVRDKIIADQIIAKYREILNSDSGRKKALVIMNFRHAFPHLDVTIGTKERHIQNVGGFLMKEYPGKTASVMLNSVRILAGITDSDVSWTVLQDGKWDAAFVRADNPDIGFDFKDSPFGNDVFDYFPFKHNYTYKEIFTGFVFYKPLEKHIMRYGIPGIFDEAFKKEFIKRHRIKNEKTTIKEINKMIKDLGTITESAYGDNNKLEGLKYKELIRKWLNK